MNLSITEGGVCDPNHKWTQCIEKAIVMLGDEWS